MCRFAYGLLNKPGVKSVFLYMSRTGQNIFLIGLPGAGKSSTGKLLAENLQYPFLDTDKLIESEEGITINEMFNNYGELYFRRLETELLIKIDIKDRVVATGGGMPCHGDNLHYMKKKGLVVYLKGAPEYIAGRLKHDQPTLRPLINDSSMSNVVHKLKGLLRDRSDFYDSADFIVDCQQSTHEVVSDIRKCLR